MLQETHVRPNTGLQSFAEASPDYMLAPVGLGSFQRQAQKLAEYGRNGDIYVVHAAEGETVIPVEVLDANPKVRALLFNQMREMGMDPNEYVVGDELNSINPATGLPEFFFKSVFKSIGKAAKKVFKVAKKVAPIVLPLALSAFGVPFLGTAFPALFGQASIGAAFLGSGIGTLIGGGGIKDALKSGLMSAATAGLMKGIGSAASPGGFSLDSLKGTPSTWGQLGSVVSGSAPASSLIPDLNAPKAGWLESFPVNPNGSIVPPVPAAPVVAPMGIGPGDVAKFQSGVAPTADLYASPGSTLAPQAPSIISPSAPLAAGPRGVPPIPRETIDPMSLENDVMFMSRKDGSITGRPNAVDVAALGDFTPPPAADPAPVYHGPIARPVEPQAPSRMSLDAPLPAVPGDVPPLPRAYPSQDASRLESIVNNMEKPEWYEFWKGRETLSVGDIEKAAFQQGVYIEDIERPQITEFLEKTNPGWLERNRLPLTGVGVASAVFKDKLFGVDDEDPGLSEEQQAQMNAARGNSLWDVADLPREPGETDEDYADRNNANKFAERQNRGYIIRDFQNPYTALVASGGLMQSGARGGFPRRELLIEGPGTGRSDDIPAMLSDGEFVMNASAVRGADPTGRGNRHAGARNLYNIMRNFEMRA